MPQSIADLGKAAKTKYPGAYDHIDDAELGRKIKETYPGAYDQFADAPGITESGPIQQGPRTLAQKAGVGETWQEPILDFFEGVGSGVAKTAVGIGDIVNMSQGLPPVSSYPLARALTATPPSPAGQAGEFAEQAAEYFIPGPPITKATKFIKGATAGMRAAPAINLGARMGLEAGGAALMAGAQTGGNPEAMKQAALTAGAFVPVVGAASKLGQGYLGGAEKQYQKVLHPGKEKFKYASQQKVVPGLLERGKIVGSLEGLKEHSMAQVQKFGQDLDDAYKALPSGSSIDAGPVLKFMDDETAHLYTQTGRGVTTMGPEANIAIRNMERLKQVVFRHAEWNPATGKWEIPVDRIRKLRQHFDTVAEKAGSFHGKTLAEANKASAYTASGNAIRAELAKAHPNIDVINKEYSFWRNVADVTDATILRRVGQAPSLGRRAAQAVGGVVGGVGAQAGGGSWAETMVGMAVASKTTQWLEEAFTSPLWRTVSATTKNKIANALASGKWPEVEFWLRKSGIGVAVAAPRRDSEERRTAPGRAFAPTNP